MIFQKRLAFSFILLYYNNEALLSRVKLQLLRLLSSRSNFIIGKDVFPMKILVINAGSSSLKYQLIDMTDESVICKGNCERIGDVANSLVSYKTADHKIEKLVPMPTHTEAFETIIERK